MRTALSETVPELTLKNVPKVKKLILRWDPGGAQEKSSKCPRLENPTLGWDFGAAKLVTVTNFMRLQHVFHGTVQLYFQWLWC